MVDFGKEGARLRLTFVQGPRVSRGWGCSEKKTTPAYSLMPSARRQIRVRYVPHREPKKAKHSLLLSRHSVHIPHDDSARFSGETVVPPRRPFLPQGVPSFASHPCYVESQQRPVQQGDASSKARQRFRQRDRGLRSQVGPFSREAFMRLRLQHDLHEGERDSTGEHPHLI